MDIRSLVKLVISGILGFWDLGFWILELDLASGTWIWPLDPGSGLGPWILDPGSGLGPWILDSDSGFWIPVNQPRAGGF